MFWLAGAALTDVQLIRDILLKPHTQKEEIKGVVTDVKAAPLSNFHSKHCPGLLMFPSGSIATREFEQNRQRMVLSQLPVGIQPEGLNMLLTMNYSLFTSVYPFT